MSKNYLKKYKFRVNPYDHQFETWDKSKRFKYYGLLWEMGIGKSKITIDTFSFMFDNGWINAVLIFGNKGSYENWLDEHIPEHIPKHINYKIGIWRSVLRVKEKRALEEMFQPTKEVCLKIFIMNIEALSHKRSLDIATKFIRSHDTFSVIDESTTIKNPKSLRTKAAWTIGRLSKARRILTGSAIDDGPLKAWAQFQFLKPGCLGYTSYYTFRAQFALLEDMETKSKSFKVVVGYKNLEYLREIISKNASIIKTKDCLDLPKKTYLSYNVELTDEQKKHYTLLKENAFTVLDEKSIVTTKIVLTKLLRLHQVVCGHLKDDNGKLHKLKHNRLDVLDSVLEETQGRVIIWANFRENVKEIYKFLCDKYGREKVVHYFGDTKQEDRARAKRVLKRGQEEKVKYFIGNQQTGGFGLNLTAATTAIYYSNNFVGEYRNQSEKRIHRIGQTKPVKYIDLVSPKTIDEKIIKALRSKKSLSDLVTPSNWKEFF
jgi:SNF2 family DNA or RNA helicase